MIEQLKRVPTWAWWVTGGVVVGGTALKVVTDRRNSTEASTTGTDPTTGEAVSTIPGAPGVIVPPVIVPPSQQAEPDTSAIPLQELYIGGVGTLLSEFQTLILDPREQGDLLLAMIGAAGGPPQPAQQLPPVVNVSIPAYAPPPSAPVPTTAAPTAAPTCKGEYGKGAFPNCYKDCKHCETGNDGKKRTNHGHCHSDGRRVHVSNTPGC